MKPYYGCLSARFAQPPPGDPYARAAISDSQRLGELPDPLVLDAELLEPGPREPDCGSFLVESRMTFRADHLELHVLVPCAELPRPLYSADAGDAPVLQPHRWYRLQLAPGGAGLHESAGPDDHLFRAVRIDAR